MPLLRISLSGYRCFDASTTLDLRPLTIVLGRNNSGKSALVRAPMVIEQGIRTTSSQPIDLDALDDQVVESFTDLIYGHRPHGSIELSLDMTAGDGAPLSVLATVQNVAEYDRQLVSILRVRYEDRDCWIHWIPRGPDEPDLFQYSIRFDGKTYDGIPLSFQGLLPVADQLNPPIDRFFGEVVDIVRDSYPLIRYFGPFRDRPERRFRSPVGMPPSLGISGENAGRILATDYARRGGVLLREVNSILARDLPGWTLALSEQLNQYSIILRSNEDPALNVNLADAGTGVAQVLPVFVQRALDVLTPPERPVLEIMEQPELHLHPAAHGGLADLYLSASLNGKVKFLIETHSETLLLRVRRRIAEGSIHPDHVALYFVEHERGHATARQINIGPDGDLDYWPDGVFSEDYEEARALASAQLKRGDQGAR
jgi:Protein of unknown function (DUF3696)